MDLAITRETFGVDDLRWLGSKEGTDTARSVTLDVSGTAFDAVVDAERNVIPSGTPLQESGNSYVPFVSGGTLAGFLLAPVKLRASAAEVVGTQDATANGALLDRGRVVTDFLPAGSALDAAGQATNGRFVFVSHDGPNPVV